LHGKKKSLAVVERILENPDFWWLLGYLQGDGTVDDRNGVWFHSTDQELIVAARQLVNALFGLDGAVYAETRPPWKTKLRLVVYSRSLVKWLYGHGFKFGRKSWNVPILRFDLFCSYIAGLFDAEGQVVLRKNQSGTVKLCKIVLHSTNGASLQTIGILVGRNGLRWHLRERHRKDRLGVYFELDLIGRPTLEWFVRHVGVHSHLTRRKEYLKPEFLPRTR